MYLRTSRQTQVSSLSTLVVVGLLGALVATSGCTKVPPPEFHLNMQGRDPADFVAGKDEDAKIRIQGRQDIADALYAMFGTPDAPYVFPESGLDLKKIELAAGKTGGSENGTQRGLYRQHCAHCHGISGDGAGPTAAFLTPYPRDYRRGLYKFKATERADKPTDADLARIIREGIMGTAMPSFALLRNDEVDALVEYVKYLSARGETELGMANQVYENIEPLYENEKASAAEKRTALVENYLQPVVTKWQQANEKVIQPPAHPAIDTPEKLHASIVAGAELFKGGKAQCTKCHGPTALGDGSEEALFDDWNKDKKPNELARWLLPKQQIQPRNLRAGIYRFGRSPADMYRRIYAGINGTPMPAAGPAPGSPGTLKPEEIWQIVDYVRSLPYEAFSKPHTADTTVHKAQL